MSDHELIEALKRRQDEERLLRNPLPIVGDGDWLTSLFGRPVPKDLLEFAPWGHRIVVWRDEPLRQTSGGIVIPESAVRPIAAGRVISVGHLVGQPHSSYTGWCPVDRRRLIGARLVFDKFAGRGMKLSATDDDFLTEITILSDNEVFGTVGEFPADKRLEEVSRG